MRRHLLGPFSRQWRPSQRSSYFLPQRIPSDNFPTFSLIADFYCCCIMIVYSAIFLAGWNFHYPTNLERTLWRVASIITLAYTYPLSYGLGYLEYRYFGDWRRRDDGGWVRTLMELHIKMVGLSLNTSPGPIDSGLEKGGLIKPWRVGIPWGGLAYCTGVCALYCFARAYLLVEDIIGLRRLPTSAYQTVSWSRYLPLV